MLYEIYITSCGNSSQNFTRSDMDVYDIPFGKFIKISTQRSCMIIGMCSPPKIETNNEFHCTKL